MKIYEIITEAQPSGVQTLAQRIAAQARHNKTRAARVEKVWMGKFGTKLTWIFRALGLTYALTGLYTELDIATEEYHAGRITQQQLEEHREFTFGVFQTQVLLPVVIKWLGRAAGLTLTVRIVKNLAAIAGGAVTGGASVVAAVATEAFMSWLQGWLGSQEGRDWLAKHLMFIIRTQGKVGDTIWSELTGYYEKGGAGAPEKHASAPDATGQAGQAVNAPKAVEPVYVGGVQVTDAQGKLRTAALNDLRVRQARDAAKRAGQPDPIAAIQSA